MSWNQLHQLRSWPGRARIPRTGQPDRLLSFRPAVMNEETCQSPRATHHSGFPCHRPILSAIFPATKKSTARKSCIQPVSVTPAYLFRDHTVRGHADNPEHSANHPFVSIQGPLIQRYQSPPPPAMMAQIQPTIHATLPGSRCFSSNTDIPGGIIFSHA